MCRLEWSTLVTCSSTWLLPPGNCNLDKPTGMVCRRVGSELSALPNTFDARRPISRIGLGLGGCLGFILSPSGSCTSGAAMMGGAECGLKSRTIGSNGRVHSHT
jgi:hypothetical protein